jgi:hypothetical protein
MHFPDLNKCRYHSGPLDAESWKAPLLAVGWLEHPHQFARGESPAGLLTTLRGLVVSAKTAHPQVNFRGLHCCSLCEASRGVAQTLMQSHVNLFIPGREVVYVAPAGIVHYIEAHSYMPPSEFSAAVARCPIYGSFVHYEALTIANMGTQPPMVFR